MFHSAKIFEDRWYQRGSLNALYGYFHDKPAVVDGNIVMRNPLICLPTGTGKSYVIARFAMECVQHAPMTRVLVCTHVKELVDQNAKTLKNIWPNGPVGVYSAGLKRKEVSAITYAGIMSIKNALDKVGKIDIMIIDEAHLLSPNADGVYQDVINRLRAVNPYLVVVGFTATPYRLGIGMLTNNGIFTDTVYDCTSLEMFKRLVHEGYLSPLITRHRPGMQIDLSNVHIQNGEFKLNELQAAADDAGLTDNIVRDIIQNGYYIGRRCALIFCSGVDHAIHVSECFARYGFNVPAVHSKLKAEERDAILSDFKAGKYWGVTNNNVLTTGFDHPPIDFIGMIRATTSTGLYVQMLGRGTRPSPETGKIDCLVYDYAGNALRLGPINDPVIPTLKEKGNGKAPIWVCPRCECANHTRAAFCVNCGEPHDMTQSLMQQAGTSEVMITEEPITEYYQVNQVLYFKHTKQSNGNVSLMVSYICGMQIFNEYVALEHPHQIVSKRARDWWRARFPGKEVPQNVDQALQLTAHLKRPERLLVQTNLKYPQIVQVEF